MRKALKFRIFPFSAILCAVFAASIGAALSDDASPDPGAIADVAGRWLTDDGDAHIVIADCGDGSPCGAIAWISPDAEGDIDANNPDPALNGRPLVGAQIIGGFERKGDRWKNGWIYDPKDGKTYRSILEREDDDKLKVKGCVGPFCRTIKWTAVDAPDA